MFATSFFVMMETCLSDGLRVRPFSAPRGVSRKEVAMRGFIIICNEQERQQFQMLEKHLTDKLGTVARCRKVEVVLRRRVEETQAQRKILVREGHRNLYLEAGQILYLEKQLRKVIAYQEGRKTVSFYSKMETLIPRLGSDFCHCHKSFIVNMEKVTSLEKDGFRMQNGFVVPVSQRRRKIARLQYEEFLEEKTVENQGFTEIFSCFEI